MKKVFTGIAIFFLIAVISGNAYADLDSFLSDLNNTAKVDKNRFNATLSSQFGIPLPHVQAITDRVVRPADAFMCLQLGQMTNQHPDRVLQVYQNNKGKGWGVIAKELGIKPGSAEFHALKRGNFTLSGEQIGKTHKGNGKGKGKGKKGKKHDK